MDSHEEKVGEHKFSFSPSKGTVLGNHLMKIWEKKVKAYGMSFTQFRRALYISEVEDGATRRRIMPEDLQKQVTNGTKLFVDYDYKTFKASQKEYAQERKKNPECAIF